MLAISLNKCCKIISNVKYYPLRCIKYNYQTRASVTFRDILDSSHGESGTLQARFIKYIALESCKLDSIIPKTIRYAQYYPLGNLNDFERILKSTDQSQIPQVTIFTSSYKSNGNPSDVANIITIIDNTCCENLTNMNVNEILRNLYSFMYLIPNKITKLQFYKFGIKKAIEMFEKSQPKEVFVQLCYYLGLSKNFTEISKLMNIFLSDNCEFYLNNLNTTDFAIIANAAFKTVTLFHSKKIQERLVSEIIGNDLDDDFLITFIKSLRLHRLKSDEIIHKLNFEIKDRTRDLDFKGICHIFAFFAENNYNETTTCLNLVNWGKDILESLNPYNFVYNDVRPKDLATFLWCCAQLKIYLQEKDLKYFENIISKKIDRNEYVRNADELIDTCLSLWMLNYKSVKLIREVIEMRFSDNQGLKQRSNDKRFKLESRLKLLTNLLQIEPIKYINIPKNDKTKPFDNKRLAPEYLCKTNTNLNNLYNLIVENRTDLNVKDIKIVLPILELNIPSLYIEINEDKQLLLEILDKTNKLRFNNEPNAYISLKVNTLKYLEQKVSFIDIENIPTNNILEEIKKILNC